MINKPNNKFNTVYNSSSVVVIGGGVFGCAAAFQLAKRGIKTTLIERDDFGSHASGKNPGNLNPVLGSSASLLPLALESFQLHQTLASELAELGCESYDLKPVRRILLAFDAAETAQLEAVRNGFEGVTGFTASSLDAQTLLRMEPRLSTDVCAGLLLEGNMSVDSRTFNRVLADGAAKLGATLLRRQVSGLEKAEDRVIGVHTSEGTIACDSVVLATGPWVTETRDWLDFDQPVLPVKGEMLRVRLPEQGLQYDFTRDMISLYRRGHDECWIGVTKEHAGFDETPTAAGRKQLLQAAAQIMPSVEQAEILEHFASLRPMTPSGLPIVGRVPGWQNAYVANGGGIKGMLLCAGVGLAIAQAIIDPGVSINITSS